MLLLRLSAVGCVCLCLLANLPALAVPSAGDTEKSNSTADSAVVSSKGGSDFKIPLLVGTYPADGKYRLASQGTQFLDISESLPPGATRPVEVPPSVDLGSTEWVIEDFAPPMRARKTFRHRTTLTTLRDSFLGKAYGPERILRSPTHLVTDSKGRLIVTDVATPAIHVLGADDSFRIVGGPQHRMVRPNGVAVDADDNIYVADEERELVLVYNRDGQFLSEIGRVYGESMFQKPTALAIDRASGRLFVLDSPYNELVVMDLNGRVLKRIGGHRDLPEDLRFDQPTEVVVGPNRIAVLDTLGTRIVVLDGTFAKVSEFTVASVGRGFRSRETGLALDRSGRIYVGGDSSTGMRIYNEKGTLIGAITNDAPTRMMFSGLSGLWIDAAEHIYATDTGHRRVQVFEIAK